MHIYSHFYSYFTLLNGNASHLAEAHFSCSLIPSSLSFYLCHLTITFCPHMLKHSLNMCCFVLSTQIGATNQTMTQFRHNISFTCRHATVISLLMSTALSIIYKPFRWTAEWFVLFMGCFSCATFLLWLAFCISSCVTKTECFFPSGPGNMEAVSLCCQSAHQGKCSSVCFMAFTCQPWSHDNLQAIWCKGDRLSEQDQRDNRDDNRVDVLEW